MEIGTALWLQLPHNGGWIRGTLEGKTESHYSIRTIKKESNDPTTVIAGISSSAAATADTEKNDDDSMMIHSVSIAEAESRVCIADPELLEADSCLVVSDLATLSHVNEPEVVNVIESRYFNKAIFTMAGPTLMSVNPFSQTDLFSTTVMDSYLSGSNTSPHLYNVATTALRQMLGDNFKRTSCKNSPNQSIIISGESGSGKSETAKFLMEFLTHASSSKVSSLPDLKSTHGSKESVILQSSPILESFGNARTTKNDNSSRFGKFIQMRFCPSVGISGANIQTCLLEKMRLVSQATGERNFHIFYEMDAGLHEFLKEDLCLKPPHEFHYLSQGLQDDNPCTRDDPENFNKTYEALSAIGLVSEEKNSLFQILAGILHMGEMVFEEVDHSDSNDPIVAARHSVQLVELDSLELASEFFGIDMKALQDVLCSKLIRAGEELVSVNLTLDQAGRARDGLAKEIYSQTFTWLVSRINAIVNVKGSSPTSAFSILDIFGFEAFSHNSLEQLCINYANEKLQQLFVSVVIQKEQDSYTKEHIIWKEIDTSASDNRVGLFDQKPFGILPLLDETCIMPKGSDVSFVNKLNMCCKSNAFYANSRIQKHKTKMTFSVKHFASTVVYDATGFCMKNTDQVSVQAMELLFTTSNEILLEIMKTTTKSRTTTTTPRKNSNRLARSLTSQFKDDLTSLLDTISATQMHFIRCIKPNDEASPTSFRASRVGQQVVNSGTLDAISVSREGYPVQVKHVAFVNRYKLLLDRSNRSSLNDANDGGRLLLLTLLQKFDIISSSPSNTIVSNDKDFNTFLLPLGYQFGTTRVYMTTSGHVTLERLLDGKKEGYATQVQSRWRVCIAKRVARTRVDAAIKITSTARHYVVSQYMNKFLESVAHKCIVDSFRDRVAATKVVRQARKTLEALANRRKCATRIQATRRRYLARLQLLHLRHRRNNAIVIQCAVRVRTALVRIAAIRAHRDAQALLLQCALRQHFARRACDAIRARNVLEAKSSTVMQCLVRRKLAYNAFKRALEHRAVMSANALVVQRNYRRFQQQRSYTQTLFGIVRVQTRCRMVLARLVRTKLQKALEERRNDASNVMQRLVKRFITRCRLLRIFRAIVKIQSVFRRGCAVKRVCEIRLEILKPKMAVKIQRRMRYWYSECLKHHARVAEAKAKVSLWLQLRIRVIIATRVVSKLRQAKLEKLRLFSVNLIKASYRRKVAYNVIAKLREAKCRADGASLIQYYARRMLALRQYRIVLSQLAEKHREMHRMRCIIFLQAICRRIIACSEVNAMRKRRTLLNTVVYMQYQFRKDLAYKSSKTVVVQCAFRQYVARRACERIREFNSAVMIQCIVRRKIAYVRRAEAIVAREAARVKRINDAATTLQCMWRVFIATMTVDELREVYREDKASRSIQSIVKCHLVVRRMQKAHKVRHKAATVIQAKVARKILAVKIIDARKREKRQEVLGSHATVIQSMVRKRFAINDAYARRRAAHLIVDWSSRIWYFFLLDRRNRMAGTSFDMQDFPSPPRSPTKDNSTGGLTAEHLNMLDNLGSEEEDDDDLDSLRLSSSSSGSSASSVDEDAFSMLDQLLTPIHRKNSTPMKSVLNEEEYFQDDPVVDAELIPSLRRSNSFEKSIPTDDDIDDDISAPEDEELLTSRKSLDISTVDGSHYKLLWEDAKLGLKLKFDKEEKLPSVTNFTGKSSMIGLHLVDLGDFLVSVGKKSTYRLPFEESMEYLRNVEKPVQLTFKRASSSARSPPINDPSLMKNELAVNILHNIKNSGKAVDSVSPVLTEAITVTWKKGTLGVNMISGKGANHPQVTRVNAKSSTGVVNAHKILAGYFLVKVGSYNTSDGTFMQALNELKHAKKPIQLIFCPRRPAPLEDEYEMTFPKKDLGFTKISGNMGEVLVSDNVTTNKKGARKKSSTPAPKVGDRIIMVNDENVMDQTFLSVMLKIREANRPLMLRMKKGTREQRSCVKQVRNATLGESKSKKKKDSNKSPPASPSKKRVKEAKATTPPPPSPSSVEKPTKKGSSLTSLMKNRVMAAAASLTRDSTASSRASTVSSSSSSSSSSRSSTSSSSRNSPIDDKRQRSSRALKGVERSQSTGIKSSALKKLDVRKRDSVINDKKPPPSSSISRASSSPASANHRDFKVEWKGTNSLGLTFRADSKLFPKVVSFASEKSKEMAKVKLGDVLIAVNGRMIKPAKDFQKTLEQVQKASKPATLVFRRKGSFSPANSPVPSPTRQSRPGSPPIINRGSSPRSPQSSPNPGTSPTKASKTVYSWVLSKDSSKAVAPKFVRGRHDVAMINADTNFRKDATKRLRKGDVLVVIGSTTVKGMDYDDALKLLKNSSLPVTLKLQRRVFSRSKTTGSSRSSSSRTKQSSRPSSSRSSTSSSASSYYDDDTDDIDDDYY